jgi:hypothetical protein
MRLRTAESIANAIGKIKRVRAAVLAANTEVQGPKATGGLTNARIYIGFDKHARSVSSADEDAQESDRIGASFFTYFFVAGAPRSSAQKTGSTTWHIQSPTVPLPNGTQERQLPGR